MSNICCVTLLRTIIKPDRCNMQPVIYDEDYASRFRSDTTQSLLVVPWQVSPSVGFSHLHSPLPAPRGPSPSATGVFHDSWLSVRWMILSPRRWDGVERLSRGRGHRCPLAPECRPKHCTAVCVCVFNHWPSGGGHVR